MGSYKWVISRVTILITHIRGLITLLRTTHKPPSNPPSLGSWASGDTHPKPEAENPKTLKKKIQNPKPQTLNHYATTRTSKGTLK